MAKLVLADRNRTVRVYALGDQPITLGREPENDVQLDGLEVSRRHCRIEPLPKGGYRIIDLGSKNGTFLNGRQITAMALEYDDTLRLGDSVLVFVDDDTEPEEALRHASDGGFWNPVDAGGERPPLLEGDEDSRQFDTWQRKGGRSGPHTRSSNRRYLKEQLLRLGVLTQSIASAPDLRELIETILDEVLDFTGFERGLLLLGDGEDQRRMKPVLGRNMDHENLDEFEQRFSKGLVEEAVQSKRIVLRTGVASGEDSFSARDSVVSMGLESALCIPLTATRPETGRPFRERRARARRSWVLGAIYLDSTSPVRSLDKADLKLLEMVGAQAAIALYNARLRHEASTDPLTGLLNRGFMRQVIDDELKQAREHGEPVGLLLLDLDHFKRINDSYGHDVGDEVLKRAAQRIRRTIRRDDHAARWGGEEFLVLLPRSDLQGAMTVAEKIARAIKGQPIGEQQVRITVSIGVSLFPDHGENQAQLIKHADQALYAAKNSGRDRVLVFHPELDHPGHRSDPFESLFDRDAARTQRNLKALFDTIDLLRSSGDPEEILAGTLDNVCDLTRARRALLVVSEDDGELRIAAARSRGRRPLPEGLRDYSRSIVRKALEENRSLCMVDSFDPQPLSSSSIDRLGLNTVMAVPLTVADQLIGVLYADDTTVNREFGDRDLAHLELMAHQLGLSLAANPALYEAVSGRTEERETARLRAEVIRLKAELERLSEQTRLFRTGSDAG